MNRQPFETPPQWWPPKMTPWLVRWWRPSINRTLRNSQRITQIDVQGIDRVQTKLAGGCGVLVTPNHSFHYDSYVMIESAHRVGRPFHILTAWQVFGMGTWFERQVLQWHGCFSINREANDVQAFKQSIEILKSSEFPLIIFPEGDIYHCNDRLTPFRDGAAAIALSASKKADRPIVIVPTALKCFYVQDPTEELKRMMSKLEEGIQWRPKRNLPLHERIYQFADGLLSLKELEYLGAPRTGNLGDRIKYLSDAILQKLEQRHNVPASGGIVPERVKECRRALIKGIENEEQPPTAAQKEALLDDLDDMFFVVQLFSYPGDYVAGTPTIERVAETIDKFEEDIFRLAAPSIRGERHAVVKFGEPIPVPKEREGRNAVAEWTSRLESAVQGLLDEINAERRGADHDRAA